MARLGGIDSQYFNANGDPLSGGKLFFYDTGTLNLKTTYSNAAMTTPNANPVILDAAGVPGDIFFSGTAKIVLKDANDVQIRVVDPVEACCAESGGGLTYDTTVKTSSFTAVAGNFYFVDLGTTGLTVTMPESPSVGDRVGVTIAQYDLSADSEALQLVTVGSVFFNGSNGFESFASAGAGLKGAILTYIGGSYGWVFDSTIYSPSQPE